MNLLIIEDELRLSDMLRDYFVGKDHAVTLCGDGWNGLDTALTGRYDVIVLDVMLPGMAGFEVLSRLRASDNDTPVLMLTARSSLQDKLAGFESGAEDYQQIVYPLPVEDLLYVGPATKEKLRRGGVYTIGHLAQCDEDYLKRRLGKMGLILKMFASGHDNSPVQRSDHIQNIKSVGNSGTTPRDLENDEDVKVMLCLLAESVAMRMRELASRCTVVEVSVRDSDLFSFTRQRKLLTPTCSSNEIAETAFNLFRKNYHWNKPIRSVGVRGSGLVEATDVMQLSLYEDDKKRERRERIDTTMDGLRRRFGYQSIQHAIIRTDPLLAGINRKDDHTIHPVGYFAG